METPVFDLENLEFGNLNEMPLQAVVVGPSGAGKSYLMRSYTGRVLYLHDPTESHGKYAASGGRATVLPINITKNPTTNEDLTADEAFEFVQCLLTPEFLTKHNIDCVAIDSLTGLEKIVRKTGLWKGKCLTTQGKHNSFQEPVATSEMLNIVLTQLVNLSEELKIDYVVMCLGNVTDIGSRGEYLNVKPSLMTYGVVEGTLPQFADVLLLGPITKQTDEGAVTQHCFQFNANIKRESKNEHGEIRKTFNFRPRITGADKTIISAYMLADLDKIKEMKKK